MKHVKQGIHENRRAPFEMKLDGEIETESTQEMPTSSKDYDKRNVQQRSKKKICSQEHGKLCSPKYATPRHRGLNVWHDYMFIAFKS